LGLIADWNGPFHAVTARQDVEVEAARQRRQNRAHLRQHEPVFLHVRAAHALRQPGAGRLRADERIRRLRPVADRERGVQIELAGGADPRDQVIDRDFAQDVARARRLAHVALDQPAVGAADTGDRLAVGEVHDLVDIEARVGLAPPQNGKVNHGRINHKEHEEHKGRSSSS
jgi:hypothetical protein